MNRRIWLITACLIPWLLAAAALGWLLVKRFPPSGISSFSIPFNGTSAWMNPFLPSERVTPPGPQDGGAWSGQRILQDPVYASARTPGVYDTVDIDLEFRPLRQPLVELGVVRGTDEGSIEFSPIWFAPLEDPSWSERPGIGFVRGAVTTSQASIALWRATTSMALLSDPASDLRATRVTLRGTHDFYAVPAGRHVTFHFQLQDVNRSTGSDNVVFRVYRGDQLVSNDSISVGASRDSGMSTVVEKTIDIPNASPGVYHIQVIDDDDVFIRSVVTNATHWVVGPRLVFGDDVGFTASTTAGAAWTDSRHLVVQTFHKEGLQTVQLGTDRVTLVQTHTNYPLDRTDNQPGVTQLRAPKGDLRIVGDGWFALTPNAWFAPQPRRLTDATNPMAEGLTVIRTPYSRPTSLGDGWQRAHATFTLDPSQDHIRFVLSAPGVISRNGSVDIRHVQLTYHRPALSWDEWWHVMREELTNTWHRLRSS